LPDYQKILDQMNERDPDPTEVARRQALRERFVRRGRIVSDFLFHNYLYNPLPETKPRKRSSPKDREARSTFEPKHLDRLVRYRMSVAQEALDFPISKNIPQNRSTEYWTAMAWYIVGHLPSREDADLFAATSEILTAILMEIPELREEFVERARTDEELAELIRRVLHP
jgi:hypothetical protein